MGATEEKFPEVQPGGSLILAWQVKGKNVLVIGGGEVSYGTLHTPFHGACVPIPMPRTDRNASTQVAAGRILNCLNADALVTVICPSSGLNPEVAHRVSSNQITHIDRKFRPSDLDHPESIALVLVAIDDPAGSTEIWKLCKQKRIAANIADVPPECDFYFGSVHRDGPLQIMVSTNGKGPRIAAAIRRQIARGLPKDVGKAIERVGVLRGKLRGIAPKVEDGAVRMGWMSKVCDYYGLGELEEMTDEDMENLLRVYPSKKVPTFKELKGERKDAESDDVLHFDGSFGFCIGI
jgi:precorrin-2 dehydrogenase / sirohydrochlorin ferrochelatase